MLDWFVVTSTFIRGLSRISFKRAAKSQAQVPEGGCSRLPGNSRPGAAFSSGAASLQPKRLCVHCACPHRLEHRGGTGVRGMTDLGDGSEGWRSKRKSHVPFFV